MDKFGKTQNTPTHRSAMARLARKKLVILLNRGLLAMANRTIVLPVEENDCRHDKYKVPYILLAKSLAFSSFIVLKLNTLKIFPKHKKSI